MVNKKILLMFISLNSGHHRASISIEHAIKKISPSSEILNINAFAYTNPILEKIINKAYMDIIKNRPDVWGYLYDNPAVLRNVQGMRDLIHRFNSKKLKTLLEDFKPDVVICTQAFPCGMVADYKKNLGLNLPLIGVLTDYVAHSYWIFRNVDYYIAPSEMLKEQFIRNGVSHDKIKVFGIPIDLKFNEQHNRVELCSKLGIDAQILTLLIMGGSQGLGPVENIINILEHIEIPFQIIIVCGVNRKLENRLNKKKTRFRKRLFVFGHIDNVDELMELSSILITKPGGLTTAEALAKALPMIIVSPIPGQEEKNTEFLLKQGVAVKAEDIEDIRLYVQELLLNNTKLEEMKRLAEGLKKPNSTMDLAQLVMEL